MTWLAEEIERAHKRAELLEWALGSYPDPRVQAWVAGLREGLTVYAKEMRTRDAETRNPYPGPLGPGAGYAARSGQPRKDTGVF